MFVSSSPLRVNWRLVVARKKISKEREDEPPLVTGDGEPVRITLDHAVALALETARRNQEFYGHRYAARKLAWDPAGTAETEEGYEVRLSYRPARGFRGEA